MKNINTNNFDFLRIIFALTVAIAHLIELSQVEIFQVYLPVFNTELAISGFFIISGFLIAKSYENSKSLKEYILKRIKRIVPAYFFVIIVCAIFLVFISENSFSNYFLNIQFWKYLIANLTFQNYIEPCLPGVFNKNLMCAVNGALWTIKLEESFYLLVPFFYFFVKRKKMNIFFLTIIIYLFSISYFNYFVSIDYRIAKQLPGALAFFITGIIIYKNFPFFIKWRHYLVVPCLIIFFVEQYIFKSHILKPAVFGFIVFYMAYNIKFLNNFGKYGDFTYGIYIFHFPIIQIFVYYKLFYKYNPLFTSAIVLFLILVLSVLSWHIIELPYLSKSRKARQKSLIFKH